MFSSDKPISSVAEDKLKRSGFSKLLSQTIQNLDRNETFTIGLFGKWGSGKTSVVEMMLRSLEELEDELPDESKTIVVRFEPWNISDANQLLSQFLVRLSNTFRSKKDKRLLAVGNALEQYSNAFTLAELIPQVGLWGKLAASVGQGLGKWLKSGIDEKDIQKQKDSVIESLNKQPNHLLVVIDDIDRLSNDQIRQVFQLVTSVAKFPKTTYLLVFDKDIVVRALEQVQEGSGEDYLEKVIQMPIQIPDIQRNELRQILFERLDGLLQRYPSVNFTQNYWQALYFPCVEPFIKQIRDINRLCNSLEFKLSAISEDLNFVDLIVLTALEAGNSALYEWIKNNKATLTGYGKDPEEYFIHRSAEESYSYYEQQFIDLLYAGERNSISTKKVCTALTILSHLFPHFGSKIGKSYEVFNIDAFRKNDQIAHPDKFDRYFHLTIDYIASKRSEITSVLFDMGANEIKLLLLKKDEEDASTEFLEELRTKLQQVPKDRINVIVDAFVFVIYYLDSSSQKALFSVKAQHIAESVVYELIAMVPEEDRYSYWLQLIENANEDRLASIASILNMLELGYGRLAAKGVERTEYEKFLTLEQLTESECAFAAKVKDTLKYINLFSFKEWRRVLYLMSCFDEEYTHNYLLVALQSANNILRYMQGSATKWIGTGIRYEFKDDYKKYLTDEQVLQAIESEKASQAFFNLPIEVQLACAAFFLCIQNNDPSGREASYEDVEKLLHTWKKENIHS